MLLLLIICSITILMLSCGVQGVVVRLAFVYILSQGSPSTHVMQDACIAATA